MPAIAIAIVGAGQGVGDAVAERIWGLRSRRRGFRHFFTPMDPAPPA